MEKRAGESPEPASIPTLKKTKSELDAPIKQEDASGDVSLDQFH